MSNRLDRDRIYEGQPDFAEVMLPRLRARPFFRLATDEEIEGSLSAYRSGDIERLLTTWAAVASPVRATLGGLSGMIYRRSGLLPRRLLGLAFLSTMRGVLEAGRRLRSGLLPEVAAVIEGEFPWLESRHEHVPPGAVPRIDFAGEFGEFLQGGTLDDSRARWQLAAALNEVQQAHCSQHLAVLFRLPELSRHALRERELALNYLAHWSPRVTRDLWAQCIYVLDGLNAAVFAALQGREGLGIRLRALGGLLIGGDEWRLFCEGLARPQRLLKPT